MAKRRCEDWLKTYMSYTEHLESPTSFHFWTGVSTIAAVLRRQVWLSQLDFLWTPNFYIVLVAPPGVANKSTTISVGRDLLDEVPNITLGPSSLSWQSLIDAFNDATYGITNPVTGEAIATSPITCAVSELGTFLHPSDRDLVQFLTDVWDSPKRWKRRIRSEGVITVEGPWLNMIGATTPGWLADNYPERLIKEGLTSRIIFAYETAKRHLTAYLEDAVDRVVHKEQRLDLIDDLCMMSQMVGQMTISSEAKAWGKEWYDNFWATRPPDLISDRFDGYISRKQTLIHKLAIVLQVAKGQDMEIQLDTLQTAEQILTSQEADMRKVFECLGVVPQRQHTVLILQTTKCAPNQTISKRELWQILNHRMTMGEFNAALESCREAGYVSIKVGNYGVEVEYIYRPQQQKKGVL